MSCWLAMIPVISVKGSKIFIMQSRISSYVVFMHIILNVNKLLVGRRFGYSMNIEVQQLQ